ncbi:MAG: DNA repair protein RadA [Bacteroidales bacterium]|jgi:DNA repair protein RadA/Sms|nr:DNA repair protein RadA [Bacteroidales bacterium]HPE99797.1 DNA repair protein RadA [Bacteroidales bacterium]
MAKTKTAFVCQSCGSQYPKWNGKCPGCGEWNTLVEEVIAAQPAKTTAFAKFDAPKKLSEIEYSSGKRQSLNNSELDRVLGGGVVEGSVILIGGEPGIGKSTLMLQVAITHPGIKTLYVSGEESLYQIKMRAERLGVKNDNTYLLSETDVQNIIGACEKIQPDCLVIDSIQTMHTARIESSSGTISQVRECAAELQQYSKKSGVPVFIIGHITKDGSIAGPKVLEHIVDTVLQFEGDRHHGYRILRTLKNRFGSASELGIFEMTAGGLREVSNPSEVFLSDRAIDLPGTAIATTMEGVRPLLLEIQALVSPSPYGNPQRSANGFDQRRMGMLLAVLEKRSGLRMGVNDVFLNVTGGIRVDDPAVDLAVVSALASSYHDMIIDGKICFAAEVGLSGEIRPVNRIEQRISEADKLGFKTIIIAAANNKSLPQKDFSIKIKPVSRLQDVWKIIFS